MAIDYQQIYHNEPEFSTVQSLLNRSDSGRLIIDIDAKDFLDFRGEVPNLSNYERILNALSPEERTDAENLYNTGQYGSVPLPSPIYLSVANKNLFRETLFTIQENIIDQRSSRHFLSRKLLELLTDTRYVKINELSQKRLGITQTIYPNITVWLWSRVLNEFIDISPFIQSIQTTVGEEAGNFSFILPPVNSERDDQGNFVIKANTLKKYTTSNYFRESHISTSSFNRVVDGNLKRSQFFFHNIIQQNDLVFIRYETLEIEKEKRLSELNRFFVSPEMIPGNIYDMIGLVDTNTISTSGANADVSIQIQGRDTMKALIDDGSYFFPLEFAQGVFRSPGGSQNGDSKLIKRSFVDGKLISLNAYLERSILFSLQFVISQLSNTGFIPGDVFIGYGQNRNKKFTVNENEFVGVNEKDFFAEKNKRLKAIEDEIKKEIDRQYRLLSFEDNFFSSEPFLQTSYDELDVNQQKRVIDSSFNQYIQSTEEKFQTDLNRGIVARGIEGDEINIQLLNSSLRRRLSPSIEEYKALQSVKDKPSEFKEIFSDGIWQITDLLVDSNISKRRIVDSSIVQEQGSLINSIRKFCQEPFVEFWGDTYGDRYVLTARKKPYDQRSVLTYIKGDIEVEIIKKITVTDGEDVIDISPKNETFTGENTAVIDIEEKDIITESLSFPNEDEVYSWYSLRPQGYLWGEGEAMTWAFLPAIYIEEYAKVYGSRPLNMVYNYLPYQNYGDSSESKRQNYIERQVYYDLAYLIESYAHLPFTRRGVITLNGDRRIKKGTFIRHKGTDEIFLVKSVTNEYSISDSQIDRTTTIEVERGMVEKYIEGIEIQGVNTNGRNKKVSYFNIMEIDLSRIRNFGGSLRGNDLIFDNFKFNDEVFQFFLKRRQFE